MKLDDQLINEQYAQIIYDQYDQLEEGLRDQIRAGLTAGAIGFGSLLGGSQTQADKPVTPIVQQENRFISDITKLIKKHEGFEPVKYKDTRNIWTIGYGYNLEQASTKRDLANVGIDYNHVMRGGEIKPQQAEQLLQSSISVAISDARSIFPNFDSLPYNVQLILTDMSYNLGGPKLTKFKKFRKAIAENDYTSAADEMIDSRWYKQVGNRSKFLVGMMRKVANSEGQSPGNNIGGFVKSMGGIPAGTRYSNENAVIVKQGDTLYRIASDNGVSVNDILKVNPNIKDPRRIKLGQRIKLP